MEIFRCAGVEIGITTKPHKRAEKTLSKPLSSWSQLPSGRGLRSNLDGFPSETGCEAKSVPDSECYTFLGAGNDWLGVTPQTHDLVSRKAINLSELSQKRTDQGSNLSRSPWSWSWLNIQQTSHGHGVGGYIWVTMGNHAPVLRFCALGV